MGDGKYLYGASVQGIQSFIFQTNKLKEIVGASELVENVCTSAFDDFATDGTSIIRAAGNIKHVFDTKATCAKAVREFPQKVMEMAPGITISQAVVSMNGKSFEDSITELEKKLKIQRNKPLNSTNIGLMGILRSRKTGMPAVCKKGEDYFDEASKAKQDVVNTNKEPSVSTLYKNIFGEIDAKKVTTEIEKFPSHNDWLSVIHADGNGLGKVIQKMGSNKDEFKKFSKNLDIATKKAAKNAYNKISDDYKLSELDTVPLRPIVLGGDDLTVICRADIALDFTEAFLAEFEDQTNKYLANIFKNNNLGFDHLTACAGIAYIKSSFPFYFAYDLAESLCGKAKKDAKSPDYVKEGLAPSCLMFYKVKDSFTEDYNDMVERELRAGSTCFDFGPYYKDSVNNRWTVGDLKNYVRKLNGKDGNALKSHFRQWLNLMHENQSLAKQKVDRIKTTFADRNLDDSIKLLELSNKRFVNESEKSFSPIYDIISIHTVINQKTK